MTFQTFLLKYGEIGLKGKNIYMFEDALVNQIRHALKDVDGNFKVYKNQARIYVDCEGEYDYDETIEHLQKVFGLVGICPVVRMEDQGFDQLKKDVVAYMDEMYPDKKNCSPNSRLLWRKSEDLPELHRLCDHRHKLRYKRWLSLR
jgi:thiamine biosynthesis protein ThiI